MLISKSVHDFIELQVSDNYFLPNCFVTWCAECLASFCFVLSFSLPDLEMPEHDLEPPRFSRRALERILNDWMAVKTMILSGQKQPSTK